MTLSLIQICILVVLFVSCIYFVTRSMVLFNLSKKGFFSNTFKCLYWLIIFALAFFGFCSEWIDPQTQTILPMIGSLILAFYLAFLYALIIIDLIKLVRLLFTRSRKQPIVLQFLFPLFGLILFIIGLFCAISPRLTYYHLDMHKSITSQQDDSLRIVQVSDVNINRNTSLDSIEFMVDKINHLDPDYIVFTGNLIDSRIEPFVEQGFSKAIAKLQAYDGKFIVLGDHEFKAEQLRQELGENQESIVQIYRNAGLTVLQNEILSDSATGIYFIGMNDKSSEDRVEVQKAMQIIERDIAKNKNKRENVPVIILDHGSDDIAINEVSGADLMFSGNVYAGQIFPFNLIAQTQYKNSYGLYSNSETKFRSIVSSSFGWIGPMMRLMRRAEIVVVDVDFVGNEPVTSQQQDAQPENEQSQQNELQENVQPEEVQLENVALQSD